VTVSRIFCFRCFSYSPNRHPEKRIANTSIVRRRLSLLPTIFVIASSPVWDIEATAISFIQRGSIAPIRPHAGHEWIPAFRQNSAGSPLRSGRSYATLTPR
jgi:hypothetical protein